MKRISTILKKEASKLLLLTVLAGAMASCDSVLDHEEGDCTVEYRVRFKYDYNMKYANAFANEVKTVTLYAFDNNGQFVYQKTEEGNILKADDYSMKVDVEPGDYHLIAWAGLDDQSFAVPLLTPGVSDIDELTVKANRISQTRANGENENFVTKQLSSLWHGESVRSFTRSGKQDIITIDLVKNTNTLRIVLNQMEGTEINIDKFDFSVYDDNGLMNYDNRLLKDDLLTYKPYSKNSGTTTRATENGEDTPISVAVAQISVARLIAEKKPMLRITNKVTEEVVIQLPLIEYLKLLRMDQYTSMSDQEYLDRQDEYSLTFFLDKDMSWLKTTIIINGWTIRLNDSDL